MSVFFLFRGIPLRSIVLVVMHNDRSLLKPAKDRGTIQSPGRQLINVTKATTQNNELGLSLRIKL